MVEFISNDFLPLSGIRVITVEEKLPVTFCSMILGDLGADVIIIERPGIGNPARKLPNFLAITNRNKRSVTIDLKKDKGKECFIRLAQRSEIIIECMRPGVVKRLGIDYENIKAFNPSIIYCSVSGYGQDGPYKNWPGHDISYQGLTGMLTLSPCDQDGIPLPSGVPIADLSAGMFAAIGILSSLFNRNELKDQYIDISMADGLIYWMSIFLGQHFKGKVMAPGLDEPGYGIYRTSDGMITLSIAHEDYFWFNLCNSLNIEKFAKLTRRDRLTKKEELKKLLEMEFNRRTTKETIRLLTKANVPCAPIFNLSDITQDKHFIQRGMIVEIEDHKGGREKQISNPIMFSGKRPPIRRLPPGLGEHNEEILKDLNYSEMEIKQLWEEAVI